MAKKKFDIHRFLAELRYPTTPGAKLLTAFLAILFFCILSLLVVSAFVLYRVVVPQHVAENIDPKLLIANISTLEFQLPDGTTHEGWFFPGWKGAPVIVICHGYGSTRADMLTLATSLQENHYNVFLFNFAGHGNSKAKYSTLGFREADELQGAVEMLSQREDINHDRVGIWGNNLGAYAALAVAEQLPQVRALVLDSVYDQPRDLLNVQIGLAGGNRLPILKPLARMEFNLLAFNFRRRKPLDSSLGRLSGVDKLFISGGDNPELGLKTESLFAKSPGPKQYVTLSKTNIAFLGDEERRSYENRIVNFFLKAIPAGGF